ncbi:MAG: nickel pincer cofactor biosynthesis protein LarC [Labilithrix sp.]|nr:nickel pincer cofactor biosynthesis protein LarC [Labilithrix sp.]
MTKKKAKGRAHRHHHGDPTHHHHDHDDDHHHPHDDDGHHHPHHHGDRTRPDLKAGEGKGKILFLDAPSGLAGDMIIAALVDLGVPEAVIAGAVDKLPLGGFHVHFATRVRSGIVATAFDVHVDGKQPERTYGSIRKMLERADLSKGVKARAQATFRRLAESEAKVHRMPIDDVHFHEVGGVDAIVDVVGSAAALEHIGARVVVSPLPMGHGRVKARHGILPLPPPAVVECLRGHPTYDAGIAFELVTPTGAAIVGAHAEGATRWPSMSPERTGWGAGTADLADRPNLLRAVLGDETSAESTRSASSATHVVLEANVDDATGELLGSCIDALLAEGALDAWATPLTMKKGRPAYLLGAIATSALADTVTRIMLRESTTLGVRRHEVTRVERPRHVEQVETPYGVIPVKIANGPFGPPSRKPEFDACLEAARAHRVPVRTVLEAALLASATVSQEGLKKPSSRASEASPRPKGRAAKAR